MSLMSLVEALYWIFKVVFSITAQSVLRKTDISKIITAVFLLKGLASYCKAETTFTFHFSILTLPNAFLSINNREMKSESDSSLAMASQPLHNQMQMIDVHLVPITNFHFDAYV